jgi:hypothetical protein
MAGVTSDLTATDASTSIAHAMGALVYHFLIANFLVSHLSTPHAMPVVHLSPKGGKSTSAFSSLFQGLLASPV